MIKLIVCDIDGTVLEKGKTEIDKDTVLALEKLHKSGKIICFASGRTYFSIRKIADSLSFADDIYYICCDGAVCVYRDKVLYHKQISIENMLKFARNPDYSDKAVMYYSDKFAYITGSNPSLLDELEAGNIDTLDPISGIYDVKAPIYKIGVHGFGKRPEKLTPCPFELRIAYDSGDIVEYTSRFANKGLAVSDLQMRLYLSKLDTAAFGDGDNDVEMFSKAKYTYAKRNGSEALKAVATEQFDSIADVLEKLV